MNYQTWLDEWLIAYVKPYVKIRTYDNYVTLIKHVKQSLGGYQLKKITPILLQRFVIQLLEKGLSSSSINSIITIIKMSLTLANDIGLIAYNPTTKIKRPKAEEKEVICFNIEEQKKIEQFVLNSQNKKLFGLILCLYTGIRIGELLALSWEDIDLEKKTIYINKSCHDGKDVNGVFGRIIDAPKTKASKRVIPVPKQIIPLIRAHKKQSKSRYVITDKNNNPPFVRSYQRSFEVLLIKLNIKHKGFHALRHTFATRAIECGMDVKTLSEILGHKNPTVTLTRYVHALLEHKTEMMNKLGKIL